MTARLGIRGINIMRLEVKRAETSCFCLQGPACGTHIRETSITGGCMMYSLISHALALFQQVGISRIWTSTCKVVPAAAMA